MERAQGLGLWDGTGGNGIILLSLSFFLVLLVVLSPFIGQQGLRVAGGELRHLAGLARGEVGICNGWCRAQVIWMLRN